MKTGFARILKEDPWRRYRRTWSEVFEDYIKDLRQWRKAHIADTYEEHQKPWSWKKPQD